jgi:AraC-like DNA-binding protein
MPRESAAPTVHAVVLWPFAQAMRRLGKLGLDPAEVLGQQSQWASARIPHAQSQELLRWALAESGRPDLGVLAAETVEPGHFELIELASRAQGTVGEAIATMASLVALLHDGVSLQLERGEAFSTLRITPAEGLAIEPAGYDFIVASLLIAGRRQTLVEDLTPKQLRLPYPKPAGDAAHPIARLVNSELCFDSDALEIVFDSSHLALRLVRANAKVGELLREAALELLPQDTESKLAVAVREHVRQGLATDSVGSVVIARKLHMSERTLRRKLDAEGIGLREMVDDERKRIALDKVLDESLSMDAIANDLGFTTAQALHRAFRRWTGDTVQAYRTKRRAAR